MSNVRKILAKAFGLSPGASEDEIAQALADDILSRQESPQATGGPSVSFLDGVARLTELGVPYSEACRIASKEAPALYFDHVRRSELN